MIDRGPSNPTDQHDDDPSPELVDEAVRLDDQVRGHAPLPATDAVDDTPGERRAFFDCLQFLERAWPRPTADEQRPARLQRIGRFDIERVLGQGGFGIVYLAHDAALNRTVALKVPRLHTLASRSLLDRFQREARAAATLDHPHLIPVYEAGQDDGLCYIASAYCPGPNLAEWLRRQTHSVDPHIAARLVLQLADAVAYAHSRGVLHRDIKPGNIMLVPAAQGRANGDQHPPSRLPFSPRLGDFGLAKLFDEAASDPGGRDDSAGVALLGTPAYMAPEQLEGNRDSIGPATDVYALGVVLYELLVGRPPFQGTNVVDVLDRVRSTEPVPIHRLRRDVARDLDTISLKCLAKSPAQRYDSAESLRDDLQRFLDGRPIHARPPGPIGALVKWVRRRPAAAALALTATSALLGLAGLQTWHAARLAATNAELEHALDQVTDEKARALASEHEARRVAYALDIRSAWHARQEGDFHEFSRIIDRYRDGQPLAGYRGGEWHYLDRFVHVDESTLLTLPGPAYDIITDGADRAVLVGEDALVRIVDLQNGAVTTSWPSGQIEVNSACLMPDGRSLWTAGDDGTVRLWDIATGSELQKIDAHAPAKVFKVIHAQELNLLITCGTEGVIRLWDLARNGAPAGTLEGHTDWVQDVILSFDGRRLISGSDDYSFRLWDLPTQTQLWSKASVHDVKARDLARDPVGPHFAVCSDQVFIYNEDSLSAAVELRVVDEPRSVCFDDDGDRLYVSDRLGVVHAYEITRDGFGVIIAASQFTQWRASEKPLYALRWNPRNRSILTADKDGRVSHWQSIDGRPRPAVIRYPGRINSLAFESQGRWLALAGEGGIVLYDWPGAARTIVTTDNDWTSLAVNPAGTIIAGGSRHGETFLWTRSASGSLTAPRLVAPLPASGSTAPVHSLSFSHDGRALAVSRGTADVVVLDVARGTSLATIPDSGNRHANMSPVADLIATISPAHHIEVWHWPTQKRVWQSPAFAERPGEFTFSPDGAQLLVDTNDRVVRAFDTLTGRSLVEFGRHAANVHRCAVSPDGRTVVTKDMLGWAYLHSSSGQFLFSMRMETGGGDVAFSPDGAWLLIRDLPDSINVLPMHP